MSENILYQIFECASIIFATFIVYQYITVFFQKRKEDESCVWGYVIFALGLMPLSLFIQEPLILITYTAIGVFILEVLFYNAEMHSKVFSSLFFAVLMMLIEASVAVIMSIIIGITLQETRTYGLYRVLVILISRIIAFISVKIYGSIVKWKNDEISEMEFKQLFPLLFCQISTIALAHHIFMMGHRNDGIFNIDEFFSMLGIMYISVIIFWYFDKIKLSYEYKIQKEAAETKLALQKTYYETLDARQDEINALWHDMRKHLTMVKALYNSDNSNDSKRYIAELETRVYEIPNIVKTSQPIVSALLTEELRRAKKESIRLDLDNKIRTGN